MIVKPSIAFNSFNGTAKDVTARLTKGRTVLSTRTLHKHKVTVKQALRRANFTYISRQFKTLTDEQIAAWSALSKKNTALSLTGNGCPMSAQNLFICINVNRSKAGVPILKDAPAEIHGSMYVEYDSIYLSSSELTIAGIKEPDAENAKLVIKIASADSSGVTSAWGNTVILGTACDTDWGEVDLTKVYMEQFGMTIEPGRKYFIEMYWLDEYFGYVSEVTRMTFTVRDDMTIEGKEYYPKANVSTENVENTSTSEVSNLQYEVASEDFLVVDDISGAELSGYSASISVGINALTNATMIGPKTYQLARGTATSKPKYAVGLYEINLSGKINGCTLYAGEKAGYFSKDFETFGTYQAFK